MRADDVKLDFDGSIVIGDTIHPMGSTMWQIDGIPFTPVEATINTCRCREPTIVLFCEERNIVEICKNCNEIRLYEPESERNE